MTMVAVNGTMEALLAETLEYLTCDLCGHATKPYEGSTICELSDTWARDDPYANQRRCFGCTSCSERFWQRAGKNGDCTVCLSKKNGRGSFTNPDRRHRIGKACISATSSLKMHKVAAAVIKHSNAYKDGLACKQTKTKDASNDKFKDLLHAMRLKFVETGSMEATQTNVLTDTALHDVIKKEFGFDVLA